MSEKGNRVSWSDYFMNIAREVATRSTCDRNLLVQLLFVAKQFSLLDTMAVLKEQNIAMMLGMKW